MSLYREELLRTDSLIFVAKKMLIAARTAPKGRGIDHLALAYVTNETIKLLSDKMIEMANAQRAGDFFIRDANNILHAEVVVLLGTSISAQGIKGCNLCGFTNCDEKNQHPDHPCVFNTGDLGIAVGSAVSVAMDHRVDNRIMYSVGMGARELNLLGNDMKIIYGIPLSATSKNPFFDRK
jgi:uncharacterized ferredoxin-like protein